MASPTPLDHDTTDAGGEASSSSAPGPDPSPAPALEGPPPTAEPVQTGADDPNHAVPATTNTPEEDEESEELVCHRTRFHHLQEPPVAPTLHLGVVVGKISDPLISAEWLKQSCNDDGMYQSDEAVGQYIALHHPHVRVSIIRPRPGAFTTLAKKLHDCDVVHILESEQFLVQHNYKNYRQMFQVLHPLASKLRPSLETMQFIMSKVDYIRLLEAHDIPHVPTYVIPRPTELSQLSESLRGLGAWLRQLEPPPAHLVTKPSHSGSKLHFQTWPVDALARTVTAFTLALRRLFLASAKPFVLVQPYLQGLANLEYRLYFVGRRFVSCVSTRWYLTHKQAPDIRRAHMDDPALLATLRPIAQRAVDLLPPDSAMYRVDMFCHEGQYAINEIEMVDADMMPEFHGDDTDIVQLVGDELVRMADHPVPLGLQSLLPTLDATEPFVGTPAQWRAAAAGLRGGLKGLNVQCLGLGSHDRDTLYQWAEVLTKLLTTDELAEVLEELGLPHPPRAKRHRAAALARHIMAEEAALTEPSEVPPIPLAKPPRPPRSTRRRALLATKGPPAPPR